MHLLPEQSRNLLWSGRAQRTDRYMVSVSSMCQKSCLVSLDLFIWVLCVSIKVT